MNIPKNLNECMCIMLDYVPIMKNLLEYDEETFIVLTHHSMGRSLRNEWGLWYENKLTRYFNKTLGIYHADDMSSIILTSLYRIYHNQSIKLKEQVKFFQEYWENAEKGIYNISNPAITIKNV